MRRVMATARKEAAIPRVIIQKAFDEFRAHLIGALADRGADRGMDAPPPGPKRHHGIDRCLQDAVKRALPTRMRRPDNARIGIGEENRLAIRCQDASLCCCRCPFCLRCLPFMH